MGSLNGAERDAKQPETGRASSSLSRPAGRATARRRRGRDVDQDGCRLRYPDLREAGATEVLRQLLQFANRETSCVGREPAAGTGDVQSLLSSRSRSWRLLDSSER